jgi:hypothetical protein
MKHAEPSHALIAGKGISYGIISDMAHMNFPRRVGKHLQAVEFWPVSLYFRLEGILFLPYCLNIGFNLSKKVGVLAHGMSVPPFDKGYLTPISYQKKMAI